MAATQKFIVIALTALLVCSIMISNSEAQTINYTQLQKGRPQKDLPKAGPGEANPYSRGCSPHQRCRGNE